MSGLERMREHWKLWAVAGAALLCLIVSAPFYAHRIRGMHSMVLGGPFTLQDANGKVVTDADFRGKIMLVYFGYTHCPDSCPTALNEIAVTMNDLGNHRGNVVPLFITIDPDRDHGKALQDYANSFDKSIVALSGTAAQTRAVEKAYRLYVQKVPSKDGEYMMQHTSMIYVMDQGGDFAGPFEEGSDPKRIAAKLRQLGA